MQITLTLDDELVKEAQALSGAQDIPNLVTMALKAFVQRENGRQLARLGGSEPDLATIPRRRIQDHFGTQSFLERTE